MGWRNGLGDGFRNNDESALDAGAGTDGSRRDVDMGFARRRVPEGRLGDGSTVLGGGGGGNGVMGLLSIEVGDGGRWNDGIGLWPGEWTAVSVPSSSFLGAERRRKVKLGSGPPSLSSFAASVISSGSGSGSGSSSTSAAPVPVEAVLADTNSSSPGGASSKLAEPSGPLVTGSTHPSSLSSSLPSSPSVCSCGVSSDAIPAVIITRSPSSLSPARRLRRERRPLRRVARVSPTKLLQTVRRTLHRTSAMRRMNGAVGGGTLMEEIVWRERRGGVRGGWVVGREAMAEK